MRTTAWKAENVGHLNISGKLYEVGVRLHENGLVAPLENVPDTLSGEFFKLDPLR